MASEKRRAAEEHPASGCRVVGVQLTGAPPAVAFKSSISEHDSARRPRGCLGGYRE